MAPLGGSSNAFALLEGEDIGDQVIGLLKEMYRDNTVVITWEGIRSATEIQVHKGLRQGCPLSSVLFMIYMINMERRLQKCNLGYNLSYKLGGMAVEQRFPGLMYADNAAILADMYGDLKALVNTCGDEGKAFGFAFSEDMLNSLDNMLPNVGHQTLDD